MTTEPVPYPSVAPAANNPQRIDQPRQRRLAYLFPPVCALVLFGAIAIIGGNLWQSRIQTRSDTERDLQSISHAMAEQTARTLQTIDLTLIGIIDAVHYSGAAWHGNDQQMREFVREKRNLSSHIRSIFTIDAQGRISFQLNSDTTSRTDVSDRSYFLAHSATPNVGLFVAEPVMSRVINSWLIPFSRRLENEDGSFNGAITAMVEPRVLRDQYRPVNLGEQAEVALLREDGAVLVHYPDTPNWMTTVFPSPKRFGDLNGSGGFVADSPIDGTRRLYYKARVPETTLYVLVGFAEATVFADWRRNMLAYVVIAPILLVMLSALSFWLFHDMRRRDALFRALQLSEERFRDFAQAASDRLWETDENHRFVWHSSVRPNAKFIGRARWEKAGVDSDSDEWRAHRADLDARRPFRDFKYARRQPDGSIRHRIVNGTPFFDENGRFQGYRGTYIDVTARVAEQEQATMHRERFVRAIENLAEGFALYDANDRLIVCNTRFRELHKFAGDKLAQGSSFESFLRACLRTGHITEARGREEEWLAKRLADHRNPPNVLEVIRGDRWYQIREQRDRSGGTLFFILDIHDQKTVELQNRALNERISKQFECMPVACLSLSPSFTVIDWNPAAERTFGFTREEMLGKSPYDMVVPESGKTQVQDIERRLLAGETNVVGFGENLTKDGRKIFCDWFSTSIWDEEHRCIGLLAMAMDVTERRQAEEKLRQAHRMEAVGQLTGGIAHDFNNLLQVIFGNSEILVQALKDRPNLARWAVMTKTAAERGANLTQRLLAFSRQQVLAPSVIEPRAQIDDFVELLRLTLPENIEIAPRLEDDLGTLMLDAGQLENALLNLALNARDAMPNGGRLTIEAKRHRVAHDALGDGGNGDYVALSVSDTGSGMSPNVAKRAFEPFFTTKQVDKGSGLGLSMVYGFVKQSGGHVRIDSRENMGTTVTMWFPRIAEKEEPVAAAAPPSVGSDTLPTGRETIMVVEDDAMVRSYVLSQLQSLGYEVREAESAAVALERLSAEGPVDLLFTDFVMPGSMNGQDLAVEVMRRFPATKVLFTSGYSDACSGIAPLPAGVHILNKPYFRRDLAQRVRAVLDATESAMI